MTDFMKIIDLKLNKLEINSTESHWEALYN